MKCSINRPEICKDPVFDRIKLKVQHQDTGNITHQHWLVCKIHFIQINNDPNNFHRWYNYKPAIAVVLEIVETGLL